MSFRSNIADNSRGIYFASSGDDIYDGFTIERPKKTIQAAIDVGPTLTPPVGTSDLVTVNEAQGGVFIESGIVLNDGTILDAQTTSLVTTGPIGLKAASGLAVKLQALITSPNLAVGLDIENINNFGANIDSLETQGDTSTGVNLSGVNKDIFVDISKLSLDGANDTGINITGTLTTPLDVNINSAVFGDSNQTFLRFAPDNPSDLCDLDLSTAFDADAVVKSGSVGVGVEQGLLKVRFGSIPAEQAAIVTGGILVASGNAAIGNSSATTGGTIVYDSVGVIQGNLNTDAAGTILCRSSSITGDATNAGSMSIKCDQFDGQITNTGTMYVQIGNYTGTLPTNDGSIDGVINGVAYGNYQITESDIVDLDRLRWVSPYIAGDLHLKNDTVLDGEWTMVANKNTTDRAAPQASGPEISEWNQDPDAPFVTVSQINENVVLVGHRYTDTTDVSGWLREIWFFATEASPDIFYDFFLIADPASVNPSSRSLGEFEFDRVGWQLISSGDLLVAPGQQFDLLAAIKYQGDAGALTFNGKWDYSKSNNPPAVGEVTHTTSGQTIMFSNIDKDAVDLTADLGALSAGDDIQIGSTKYSITEPLGESGGVTSFDVTPRSVSNDGEYVIEFTNYALGTIPHPQITDHYLADTPKGFKVIGTGTYPTNVVLDDNSYGFDVTFQPASFSEDWDVVATSSGGSVTPKLPFYEEVVEGFSLLDQNPGGTDAPLQIEFGAAQAPYLDAFGTFIADKSGQYLVTYNVQYGRTGGGGASQLYFWAELDGVQYKNSIFAQLDGANDDLPTQYQFTINMAKDQELKAYIVRDSAGNNSGGLESGTPTIGINPAPSATIRVERLIV